MPPRHKPPPRYEVAQPPPRASIRSSRTCTYFYGATTGRECGRPVVADLWDDTKDKPIRIACLCDTHDQQAKRFSDGRVGYRREAVWR